MAEAPEETERERDLDRLLTFVDAVVAIAITLLVLPLVDVAADVHRGDSVSHVLHENSYRMGAFALSFLVIARLWLAQHQTVSAARHSRSDLSLALIGWMLTIAFLPFPTALLDVAGRQTATKLIYLGTLIVSAVMLTLVTVAVRRQCPPGMPGRPSLALAAMVPALLGVALLLSVFVPVLSYYPLLVLTVPDRITGLVHLLRKPATP